MASVWIPLDEVDKMDPVEVGERLAAEDWSEDRRVHNWRTHVHDEIRERWQDLGPLGRWAVYVMAEALASAEEWD